MHFPSLKNFKLWQDSIKSSIIILGIIELLITIIGISLLDFFPDSSWGLRLLWLLCFFSILVLFFSFYKSILVKYFFKIKVKNITIHIKQGDIFNADGKKVIPFNEYFDTNVDDKVISKKTLHGIFINKYIDDIGCLKQEIENSDNSNTSLGKYTKNNRGVYPLGRIIPFKDFFLLSFSKFNEHNEACLTKSEYEKCLVIMWEEVCRKYAHYPVFLPLLGSGITRIEDWLDRTDNDLLKSMLRTLYISGVDIRKPITIVLTKEAINRINLYELKGVKFL